MLAVTVCCENHTCAQPAQDTAPTSVKLAEISDLDSSNAQTTALIQQLDGEQHLSLRDLVPADPLHDPSRCHHIN